MTTKATSGVIDDITIAQVTGLQTAIDARAPISYLPKVANYDVTSADLGAFIGVSSTGASRTVNLPAVAGLPVGFYVTIKKVDTTANTVTVTANGAELIDTATTKVLRLSQQSITIANTGSGWLIVQEGNTSEYGSNGNGAYFKDASGFMESWGEITIVPVANTITTGTATFPVAFSAAPKVSVSSNYGSTTQSMDGYQTITTTTALLAVLRTNTSNYIVSWAARGLWF